MAEETVVVAFGGNASYPPTIKGLAQRAARPHGRGLPPPAAHHRFGAPAGLTHGNGPVVGNILFRMARTANELPPMPMDICVAHSQGGMGYMLQQSFMNVLHAHGVDRTVSAIVTQVEVDPADPPLPTPPSPWAGSSMCSRPILGHQHDWRFIEDSGRGYRRVVPSPEPRRILDLASVKALLDGGVVPIAVGGGGIPVVKDANGCFHGVSAVIDKDLTSAMLASELGASTLVMLTGVDRRGARFRPTPPQRSLDRLTVAEARAHQSDGQFPPGRRRARRSRRRSASRTRRRTRNHHLARPGVRRARRPRRRAHRSGMSAVTALAGWKAYAALVA